MENQLSFSILHIYLCRVASLNLFFYQCILIVVLLGNFFYFCYTNCYIFIVFIVELFHIFLQFPLNWSPSCFIRTFISFSLLFSFVSIILVNFRIIYFIYTVCTKKCVVCSCCWKGCTTNNTYCGIITTICYIFYFNSYIYDFI